MERCRRPSPSGSAISPRAPESSAARFEHADRRLYLVGGSVRDALVEGRRGPGGRQGLRPRPHHRRPARRDRARWSRGGPTPCGPRASGSARSAARSGGRRYEITTHRAEVYRPDSRKPVVTFGDDVDDRPVPARLHGQRDGAAPARAPADRPVRRPRRPRRRRLRTPLDPEVSFADDPLRMLRAARFMAGYGLKPDAELVDAVRTRAPPPGDRLGRAHPRRARQARRGRDARRSALWFVVRHRAGRGVPARAAGARARAGPDPPAQGRARPHAGGGRQDVGRGPAAAPGRAVPRRGQAARPAPSAPGGGQLPPPRGGRGPHDPGADGGAALPERRDRHGDPPRRAAPAVPHLPAGVDRPGGAPLRPRRRRRCSTG